MPDRASVENWVRALLMESGWSREAAEWVITQWLPPTFHLQTPEQRADWMINNNLVASIYVNELGETVKMTPYIQENMEKLGITEKKVLGWAFQEVQNQISALARIASEAATREPLMQRQAALTESERQRLINEATVRSIAQQEEEARAGARQEVAGFPTAGAIMAGAVERARGVSPAFSQFARKTLPDIFEELGMEQKRMGWMEEWVRGATGGLGPITQEGEAQRLADIEWGQTGEPAFRRSREALRRADPWAQLLSQPTFLEQLETRFRGLSPAEKGVSTGRFKPRTRWLG